MRRSLEMQALSGEGWSVKAIAELFKCHVATVYRALQEVIEQTAEELERSIRAAADRVVEHTNELKVKAVEAVEQMKNPFLPVLEKPSCVLTCTPNRRPSTESRSRFRMLVTFLQRSHCPANRSLKAAT